jgi:hypothetical protein
MLGANTSYTMCVCVDTGIAVAPSSPSIAPSLQAVNTEFRHHSAPHIVNSVIACILHCDSSLYRTVTPRNRTLMHFRTRTRAQRRDWRLGVCSDWGRLTLTPLHTTRAGKL